MLPKRVAWVILITLFTFDAVFSYFAITQMHGREADLLIAWAVERYPLLYFICPFILILIMKYAVKVITNIYEKILRSHKFWNHKLIEGMVLTGAVIYWIIGNSFMNVYFGMGHRLSITNWYELTVVGVLGAIFYSMVVIKLRKNL